MNRSFVLPENGNINNDDKALFFFRKKQFFGISVYAFWIMVFSILAVFINSSLQFITGPVLAICFSYLYLNGNHALVTAIILIANDSLGCILMGNISFPYLLFILYVVLLLSQPKRFIIRQSQAIAGIILIIMLFTLYHYEIASVKSIIYTVTFICSSGQCITDNKNRKLYFKGIAITVFLISIHTCITGGVEFYELGEFSTAYLRKGILGVGVGDSNMSSLLLNIGIACTLFDEDFRWYVKSVMVITALFAMTVTLSTSGLIGLVITIGSFIIVRKDSIPKKIWNIFIVVLAIILVANIYISLPETSRDPTIDAYIDRMEEKLFFLNSGDLEAFTTSRSNIANTKLHYFAEEQGILGFLFGLNSLFAGEGYSVPHNTYIDLLLQIGLVGTAISILYMFFNMYIAWRDSTNNRLIVVLKIIFIYYFFNLSLYQGSLFSLAYLCMVMM